MIQPADDEKIGCALIRKRPALTSLFLLRRRGHYIPVLILVGDLIKIEPVFQGFDLGLLGKVVPLLQKSPLTQKVFPVAVGAPVRKNSFDFVLLRPAQQKAA